MDSRGSPCHGNIDAFRVSGEFVKSFRQVVVKDGHVLPRIESANYGAWFTLAPVESAWSASLGAIVQDGVRIEREIENDSAFVGLVGPVQCVPHA